MGFEKSFRRPYEECLGYRREAASILTESGINELIYFSQNFLLKDDSPSDPCYFFRVAREEIKPHHRTGERFLARNGSQYLQALVAYNTRDEELLSGLVSHNDYHIRLAVANNRKIKHLKMLMEKLARDYTPEVRAAVVLKIDDLELLGYLASDADSKVKYLAQKRLDELIKKSEAESKGK